MKIELHRIPIREVVKDYKDSVEEGVVAYGGRLDIRPKYQREFIYKPKQRNAVIETINKGFPLNVMYWMVRDDDGYEILDGQQRTISISQYVNGDFALDNRFFNNLTDAERDKILGYELMIYFCEGTDRERLDWFTTINIVGMKLTDQEIRNAVYAGPWLSAAKLKFSKTGCAAYGLASGDEGKQKLIEGSPIRQEYLETVLSWISSDKGDDGIRDYMARHQHDTDANELWLYFQSVIHWVQATFPKYRREMKGVQWGFLYNDYKDKQLDPERAEVEVARLMLDEDVTNKKGIYQYVFNRDERHLSIREFSPNQKREAYERQNGVCPACRKRWDIEEMEADHIKPWHEGGPTIAANCRMLCKQDHRTKSRR